MGRWHLPFSFWLKYFITLPILLILFSPYPLLKLFSKRIALQYHEFVFWSKPMQLLENWVWE